MEKLVKDIVAQINERIKETPEIAIILGSGLSEIANDLKDKIEISYCELKGMPLTKVEGHKNQFIFGKLNNKNVIAMQGRFHLYDGFNAKQVAMPIYIFKELGVKTLILTNAAGGINESYEPGDIVMITDHINHTGQNCLIGGAIIDYGTQFIDMTTPYCLNYINLASKVSKANNINLKHGTYIQFAGPFYETKAEIKMAKAIGADLVGMSTVIEVEAASHCKLDVLALSVVTNKAAGFSQQEMSHQEVLENGKKASKNLMLLLKEFIQNL